MGAFIIKILIRLCSLLLICVSLVYSDEKNIMIFLDAEMENISNQSCFKDWISALKKDGFMPDIEFIKSDVIDPLKRYREVLNKKQYAGTILIGELPFPTIKIRGVHARNGEWDDEVATVSSMLPLMNPSVDFPNEGILSFKDSQHNKFYAEMSTWVGSISSGEKYNGNEQESVKRYCNYFQRNIAYRNCEKTWRLKVVGFIDQDWDKWYYDRSAYKCLSTDCFSMQALSQLENINTILGRPIDFCHIASHADSHKFDSSTFFSTADIRKANPNIKFYNLFACKAGEPVCFSNLAQTFLMQTDSALGVVASTKSGSMLNSREFYEHLLSGRTFGDAYLNYMKKRLGYKFFGLQKKRLSWEAGLVIYGDPTLDLHGCK